MARVFLVRCEGLDTTRIGAAFSEEPEEALRAIGLLRPHDKLEVLDVSISDQTAEALGLVPGTARML